MDSYTLEIIHGLTYIDCLHGVFYYQTDKIAGDIGGTWTTQNSIAMQGRKCRKFKYWYKEAEKNSRNSSTSMGQKTIY